MYRRVTTCYQNMLMKLITYQAPATEISVKRATDSGATSRRKKKSDLIYNA